MSIILIWAAGIFFYILCGVLAYGILFAFLQNELADSQHTIKEDKSMAKTIAFAGPAGLIITFYLSEFAKHGIMFKEKDN